MSYGADKLSTQLSLTLRFVDCEPQDALARAEFVQAQASLEAATAEAPERLELERVSQLAALYVRKFRRALEDSQRASYERGQANEAREVEALSAPLHVKPLPPSARQVGDRQRRALRS